MESRWSACWRMGLQAKGFARTSKNSAALCQIESRPVGTCGAPSAVGLGGEQTDFGPLPRIPPADAGCPICARTHLHLGAQRHWVLRKSAPRPTRTGSTGFRPEARIPAPIGAPACRRRAYVPPTAVGTGPTMVRSSRLSRGSDFLTLRCPDTSAHTRMLHGLARAAQFFQRTVRRRHCVLGVGSGDGPCGDLLRGHRAERSLGLQVQGVPEAVP